MEYPLNPIFGHIWYDWNLFRCTNVWKYGLFTKTNSRTYFAGRMAISICMGNLYKVYTVKYKKLVAFHSILSMIGAVGLTLGMWMYNINPFELNETLVMVLFIVGGSLLLLAFFLFGIITFLIEKPGKRQ